MISHAKSVKIRTDTGKKLFDTMLFASSINASPKVNVKVTVGSLLRRGLKSSELGLFQKEKSAEGRRMRRTQRM